MSDTRIWRTSREMRAMHDSGANALMWELMLTTQEMYERWTKEPPYTRRRGAYDPGRAIYLSEAGGCARRTTLRLLKYPQAPASDAQRASWGRGLLWESYLTLLWSAWHPKRVARQALVQTPYGNGKIDIFVNYDLPMADPGSGELPTLHPHIVEVKTKEAKAKPWLPTEEHLNQLTMYLHFYNNISIDGAAYVGPRPTGELVYGIVDTNEVLSFAVAYDAERAARLIAWLDSVQQAVWKRAPLLVPSEYAPDKFPCGGESWACNYAAHCWGADAAGDEEAQLATVPAYHDVAPRTE